MGPNLGRTREKGIERNHSKHEGNQWKREKVEDQQGMTYTERKVGEIYQNTEIFFGPLTITVLAGVAM